MSSSVGGCAKCLKYMLFILNFIFLVCGITMLGVGIWILVGSPIYIEMLDNAFLKSAVYLLIVVGGIVTIVSFLGCWGAIGEHKKSLMVYAILLSVLFIGEVAVAAMVFYFNSGDVEMKILNAANATFVKYGSSDISRESWDTIQHVGECCGINGYYDYMYIDWDSDGEEFPESCCKVMSLESGTYENLTLCYEKDSNYFNSDGCYTLLKDFVALHLFLVGVVAIAAAALQLIGIIGGYCLCCAIGRDQ